MKHRQILTLSICICIGIGIGVGVGVLTIGGFSGDSDSNDSQMHVEDFGSDIELLLPYSDFHDYETGVLSREISDADLPRKILAVTQASSNYEFLELYLCDYDGKVIRELQSFSPQYMNQCSGALDLRFVDFDGNGYVDFVVVAAFITGAGPTGMVPRVFYKVYMQTSADCFEPDENLTRQFNDFFLETYRPDYIDEFIAE
jgi:hypothetical protein